MTDLPALDQAIADLSNHATAIDDAVNSLVTALQNSNVAEDFSSEISALQTASGNMQAATDTANAALTPAAATPPATDSGAADTSSDSGTDTPSA